MKMILQNKAYEAGEEHSFTCCLAADIWILISASSLTCCNMSENIQRKKELHKQLQPGNRILIIFSDGLPWWSSG